MLVLLLVVLWLILQGDFGSCFTLCYFVLVFFSPFSIVITSLGEETANLSISYVCSICAYFILSVSSSSWCLRRAVVCDCGTRWTFLLPFFEIYPIKSIIKYLTRILLLV